MNQFSRLTPRRQAALLSILRWVAVLVVGFLLLIVGYYLYFDVLNRASAEVYVAQRGTAISSVYGTVTINPVASLPLYSQNAGYLHVTPGLGLDNVTNANGIHVQSGAVLATVVDEIGQRALRSAQADYDAALARQKTGPASAGPLQSAKDNLNAMLKLPPGNVPQVQRDAARNAVNSLSDAVANETLELRHTVEAAASALKAAQDQQARTQIKAPDFDGGGVLTGIGFGDGAYVLPNQMVYTVATVQSWVTGQVNEEDVGALKVPPTPDGPFMTADVRLYAYPNVTFSAKLTLIFPAPDTNSSRYTVILTLDKPPADLKYGLTGEMNILLGRKQNALIIPARALTNVDQVLIVDDGVVEQRTVKIGFKNLELAEVVDGLKEGTPVIVSDQESFHPGEPVRPVRINDAQLKKK